MTTSKKKWFVVVNPKAGNGKSKRLWPKIKQALEASNFNFLYAFTKHAKHSQNLVQNAINQDITNIICIGGDGTLHNIVNGIMKQNFKPSNTINIGIIPIGTGNDWIKTYGISKHYKKAISTIKRGQLNTQDVGKIELKSLPKKSHYFINLLGVGFDGYVVTKANKLKHFGTLSYIVSALISLFSFTNFKCTIKYHNKLIKANALMVLIGICKYSGGGMQLTKTPNPNDGLFDISIAENFKKRDVLSKVFSLFNGKIVAFKKVKTIKTNTISVQIADHLNMHIQADGELLGTGSFKVDIIPNAFSFYCLNSTNKCNFSSSDYSYIFFQTKEV